MAREQEDREDLLREATALITRAELMVPGFSEPVVFGFRHDGSISIYLGPDLVYQFNARNEFRRGHADHQIIKAENNRLVSLTRLRQDGQVQMLRHEFNATETTAYLATLVQYLDRLRLVLANESYTLIGTVPEHGDAIERFRRWLDDVSSNVKVASAPGVR